MLNTDKPPYGNTGAQNTELLGLTSLVDWVSCTFTTVGGLEGVFDILGLNSEEFIEQPNGKNGYKRQKKLGHISVMYDGSDGMGVHVEMTGQGCREFEMLSGNDWDILFHMILMYGHFTRLDLAIDDFKGYFSIAQVVDNVRKGATSSKYKNAVHIEKLKIEDGSSAGDTLYFGSPTSRCKVRFYDKLNERLQAKKQIEEGITVWNRVEVELKDIRADMAALLFSKGKPMGELVAGILKNYITFRRKGFINGKKSDDSNKARWDVMPYWLKFLGDVEKVQLTLRAPDKTVETVHKWVGHQVAPSLGMLFLAYDSSTEWLVDFLNEGMERLGEKELALIQTYKYQIREQFEEKQVKKAKYIAENVNIHKKRTLIV